MDSYNGKTGSCSLPEALLVEIFVRSPVESLIRVKCVCKNWYALLNNPSFTKNHLEYQKKMMTRKDNGRFLLGLTGNDKKTSYHFFGQNSLASSDTASSYSNVLVHPCLFASSDNDPTSRIEGPVNGLYCITNGFNRFVIWNPATSEVGFLPFPEEYLSSIDNDVTTSIGLSYSIIGFGTDPVNEDDYKVLALCEYEADPWTNIDECYWILNTFSTNAWRLVEVDNDDDLSYITGEHCENFISNNTYLNGVYYWLCDVDDRLLLAFDMGKEAFCIRSMTDIDVEENPGQFETIGVLHKDQQIAFFVVKENKVEIWTMMMDDTWIKKMTVDAGIRGMCKCLGMFQKDDDDDHLVLVTDETGEHSGDGDNCQTVLYHTRTRLVTKIGPRGWGNDVTYYQESLAPLSGEITKFRGDCSSLLEKVAGFLHDDQGVYLQRQHFSPRSLRISTTLHYQRYPR